MREIHERNRAGEYYVNTRLGVAKTQTEESFSEFSPTSELYTLLTELIEVNAKGFRGIVVTALTGLHLKEDYDPLEDFYGCNPRSIFEGGIWYALQKHNVPCGKSDPLNVAKNVSRLNEEWAKGRRPQSAAVAAVKFLRIVMSANKAKRARLIDYFFFRLWKYAERINNFPINEVPPSKESRLSLCNKLVEFTLKYPESGNLPQFLVAQLLDAIFRTSSIDVYGGKESVFGTNTTSKKPADIWLAIEGHETNLYEITVKPVTKKRLDDSIEALRSTGHLGHSVTFICRVPEDISTLKVEKGSYTYRCKHFNFIDYSNFCTSLSTLINDDDFTIVMQNTANFVKDIHISVKTKAGWNEFFSE